VDLLFIVSLESAGGVGVIMYGETNSLLMLESFGATFLFADLTFFTDFFFTTKGFSCFSVERTVLIIMVLS
jgi:hypothetical protein